LIKTGTLLAQIGANWRKLALLSTREAHLDQSKKLGSTCEHNKNKANPETIF
jgi:hypothetical protein